MEDVITCHPGLTIPLIKMFKDIVILDVNITFLVSGKLKKSHKAFLHWNITLFPFRDEVDAPLPGLPPIFLI